MELYNKYKSKGLLVVGMNGFEAAPAVEKFAKDRKVSYPLLVPGTTPETKIAKLYGVTAFPTNYILDGDGKVVARFVMFQEEAAMKALAKLGIK